MNKYLRLATLWVCCVFSLSINSFATAPPSLTYLGIEQGLSNNAVTSIYQDHNGFMWFGTYADHNIWIGTDGGGLSIWNRQQNKFTNYRHLAGNDASLCSDFVTSITRDFQDNIWISTWGTGIYRYNKAKHSFDHYACFNQANNAEDKNTWLLYEDAAKTLWAGVCTGSPLYRFNRSTNRFEVFDPHITNILSMAEDNKGTRRIFACQTNNSISWLLCIFGCKYQLHEVYHYNNHPGINYQLLWSEFV